MKTMFVAVGSDGWRLVVWGLGSTPDAALSEAEAEVAPHGDVEAFTVHEVTEAQATAVRAGAVAWPIVCATKE